jgi:glycosyltransferase involved in cell wall biosynthesis
MADNLNINKSIVSIVLPTYNRAALIMETIESVRAQTYPNWELIVVDDGSNDDTVPNITALNEPRIKVIEAGRIGIGGRIKNIGMNNAKGELIAFIDSDDLWHPSKLEKQVNALHDQPDAGFCFTGGYVFSVKGKPLHYFYENREGMRTGDLYEAIFRSEVTSYTQALMFRKPCLEKTGPFKEERSFSDLEFIISLAEHYHGIILYEDLLYRRIHQENYITDTWEKSCREGIAIIMDNKQKLSPGISSGALFRAYIQWGEKYILHGNKRRAVHCFLIAFRYKPFSIVPIKKIGKAILK